jgi:hypothetical protein
VKRKFLTLALALGFVFGGSAVGLEQAHANYAAGAIAACSTPTGDPSCAVGGGWYGRGVMATTSVFDPGLDVNGQHVSSVYVRRDINNFCEFGWVQARQIFGYGDKDIFILCVTGGTAVVNWTRPGTSIPNGSYRFEIYENSGSPNIFRFRWLYNGVWTNDGITCSSTQCSWLTGREETADEATSQNSAPNHSFTDITMENSAYVWKDANITNNTQMNVFEASEPCCTYTVIDHGSGVGEDVNIIVL